jgi:hypothetical protein
MSLQHKAKELLDDEGQQAVYDELQALFKLPYLDIHDESDELLHHRWALGGVDLAAEGA